jgi:hypothetical protein
MSDPSPTPTAPTSAAAEPVSAVSNKRAASPEDQPQEGGAEKAGDPQSKASKRAKGENGEAVPVKQEEKNGNGNGESEGQAAKKMNDDNMEGWVSTILRCVAWLLQGLISGGRETQLPLGQIQLGLR